MEKIILKVLRDHLEVLKAIENDESLQTRINEVSQICIQCLKGGGKVLFCGNGGSASDAQHLAAELSGRFYHDRDPLFSEALHVNTSYLTAVANDYSYDDIYSRAIKAKGRSGDVLIGLSTSGNSKNIINAFRQAKLNDMRIIAFTGAGGGEMKNHCDLLLNVPSSDTPRIQEMHIMIGHMVCEIIENQMFS